MTRKKIIQNMQRSDFVIHQFPLKYTPIDFRIPYQENTFIKNLKIQVLIHKITQHLETTLDPNIKNQQILQEAQFLMDNFHQFCKEYSKKIAILDNIENFHLVQSRSKCQETFEKIFKKPQFQEIQKQNNIKLTLPNIIDIDNTQPIVEENLNNLIYNIQQNIGFPLIIKTEQASAIKNSHKMALVLSENGLQEALSSQYLQGCKLIAQKFINHNGNIYKIYVLGDFIDKQVRQSIPDITQNTIKNSQNQCWFFDSQKPFSEQLPIEIPQKIQNPLNLNDQVIKNISNNINQEFLFTLFGFDILVEQDDKNQQQNWYICDLNYFPGYKNIPNAHQIYLNHFQQQYNKISNNNEYHINNQ